MVSQCNFVQFEALLLMMHSFVKHWQINITYGTLMRLNIQQMDMQNHSGCSRTRLNVQEQNVLASQLYKVATYVLRLAIKIGNNNNNKKSPSKTIFFGKNNPRSLYRIHIIQYVIIITKHDHTSHVQSVQRRHTKDPKVSSLFIVHVKIQLS